MTRNEPTSTNPPLSFELRSDWLAGFLRADQIRTDTLVQLVAKWSDPDARDEILDALDALAAVVHGVAREGELDAAVEAVEDAASMDTARVEVDAFTARRLSGELDTVTQKLCRFNPDGNVPTQPARRTA
ncbi:hypothetical protein [Streptomyces sp. NPDC052015]|uniref:hypothetical protein n=1 Tax=Streptomyces sp. NPDC052015 TaxID=3154755 RepID=UPI00342A0EC5